MNDRYDHLERLAMEAFPRDHRRALAVMVEIDAGETDVVLYRRVKERLARQDIVDAQRQTFAERQKRKELGPQFPDGGFTGGGS